MMSNIGCINGGGDAIEHGERYFPHTDDFCLSCVCDNGTRQACVSPACARPTNCDKFEKVAQTCCTYICTNVTQAGKGTDALSTVGIRLAASTATCILAVVLVLFLMHKLRRHRIFLNIRQGLRGERNAPDRTVGYSSAYDSVDIDISYERLHIPGAPPPYTPTCEEAPPAYTSAAEDNSAASSIVQNGVVNTGCQTTPPESLYNIAEHAKSSPGVGGLDSSNPLDRSKVMVRTCGVGASYTDLSLTVDISDSCNDMRSDTESVPHSPITRHVRTKGNSDKQRTSKSKRSPVTSGSDVCDVLISSDRGNRTVGNSLPAEDNPPVRSNLPVRDNLHLRDNPPVRDNPPARDNPHVRDILPVRLEPIGGELPPSVGVQSTTPTPVHTHADRGSVSRSAGSSPAVLRRLTDPSGKVTLTQYGFIEDGSISDLLEADCKVIGLHDEQLLDIAAKKPDRLNARVRRHNRIKQISKQSAAEDTSKRNSNTT